MVLKTQPERIATIRRMAALPGSGVRPDQVIAIAQAFEKLVDDGRGEMEERLAVSPARRNPDGLPRPATAPPTRRP
jgi:hypothetical protein